MTTCNRCGGILSANARICQHCGALVADAAAGSAFGGALGARQRAQEKERLMQPPAADPFAAFAAPPFSAPAPQAPVGPGNPGATSGPGRWQAPSLIDHQQLPDWLRMPEPPASPGNAGMRRAQPGGNAGYDPFQNLSAPPFARPPAPPAPAALPPAPLSTDSPYFSSGRRSTDDLFASSSLLDRNRLPDWLQTGSPPAPARPPQEGLPPPTSAAPFAQPNVPPFGANAPGNELPGWLRAMEPGMPPASTTGRFPGGPTFPAGNRPASAEGRELPGSPPLSADARGGNRGNTANFPPLNLFEPGRVAEGGFNRPAPGTDLFGGRAPLGQPQEPRGRSFEPPGRPAVSPFGPANTPGASPFGTLGNPGVSPFGTSGNPGRAPFDSTGAPGGGAGPSGNPGASLFGAPERSGTDLFAAKGNAPGFSFATPDAPGVGPFGASGPGGAPPMRAFPGRSGPVGERPESQPGNLFAQPGGRVNAAQPASDGNLPDWLRIVAPDLVPPAAAAPAPGGAPRTLPPDFSFPGAPQRRAAPITNGDFPSFASPPAKNSGSAPPPLTPSPFDAATLIDEKELPGWLSGTSQTEPLPLPFTISDSVSSSKMPREAREPRSAGGPTGRQGTAAGTEEEALPEWLRQVYTDAQIPALPATQSSLARPPDATPAPRMNASELLDARSVPAWIREANETSPLVSNDWPSSPLPPAGTIDASSAAALPARPAEPSSLSANSLLDEASLPEWLRNIEAAGPPGPFKSSLSTSVPPKPPTGTLAAGTASGIFSAAELIDTQALPAWLKTEGEKAPAPGKATPEPGPRGPASSSGIFSAAELIDTQALPAWLKTEGEPSTPTGKAAPVGSAPPGSGSGLFSPAELIDTQALPAWLKATGDKPEAGKSANPKGEPSTAASGLFSAAELVDTQALPAWIKNEEPAGMSGSVGPMESRAEGVSKLSPMPTGFAKQQTGQFSAAELVDTQALPAWLKGATGESASAPASGTEAPTQRSGALSEEERFSAAALIDTHALPAWIKNAESAPGAGRPPSAERSSGPTPPTAREGGAGSASPSGVFSAQDLLDPNVLPAWLQPAQISGDLTSVAPINAEQPMQAPGAEAQVTAGSLAGASLINEQELPDWLRGQAGLQRPGARPPEAEPDDGPQARVPRRPRPAAEANRAPSQAAASVFSSVLGPNAGEDQPDALPAKSGGLAARRDDPRQAEFRESGEMRGRATPPPSAGPQRGPGGPPRGGFEGEPERGFAPQPQASGDGPTGGYGGSGTAPGSRQEAPNQHRSASGEMPQGRRMPPAPEETYRQRQEWSEPPTGRRIPPGRPGNVEGPGPMGGYGEPYQEQEYSDYAPASQRRGGQRQPAQPAQRDQAGYPLEEPGWEGDPGYEYEQGMMSEDEVGPPSGVFAKIKRVLGFKR